MNIELTNGDGIIVHTGLYSKDAINLIEKMLENVKGVEQLDIYSIGFIPQNVCETYMWSTYVKLKGGNIQPRFVTAERDGEISLVISEKSKIVEESFYPLALVDSEVKLKRFICEKLLEGADCLPSIEALPAKILINELYKDKPENEHLIGCPFNPIQCALYDNIKKWLDNADDEAYSDFGYTKNIATAAWADVYKWIDAHVRAHEELLAIYNE